MDDIDRYYQLLNVKPGASLEEIKQAYRTLALLWHPDRYPADSHIQYQATEKFKEINYAYDRLMTLLRDPNFSPYPVISPPPPTPPVTATPIQPPPRPPKVNPRETETSDELIPWGWLTGAFFSYTLVGWILGYLDIYPGTWLLVALVWVGLSLEASYGSQTQYPWLISLMIAGGIAGAIAGSQAGGLITAIAWAIAGTALGSIIGSDSNSRTIIWGFSFTGILAIAGWVAGAETGNGLGSLIGGIIGSSTGWIIGIISDAMFQVKKRGGVGSWFGFQLGAWLGAWSGAGSRAVRAAIANTGLDAIVGAWGAIAIIFGVVAQMVAGEKLLVSFNKFYTALILVSISGLGLTLGKLLSN
ncbi:J domain-containing protein [Limnospira fusiformis KN01]|uniref:J domain-containing protein n=1 Tax=Limnospira TaxID=2596745 RepID=UPI0016587AA4|nr:MULTISPECIES: J domain-containing protein [Limnospira]MDT9196601.1 J domain-containing protein [Limnospira sp. PMC 1042.18]ULB44903.1 J domain-containing protein [Limnospira fusiformis KN01]